MAWIKLHQSIWTHRKTFLLSNRLGIKNIYAAAHLAKLWTWCLDNAPDGDLSDLPNAVIAFGAEWDGDADLFVSALRDCGWLDEDGKLHDWFNYAGKLIESREANKERMRNARAANVQRTCSERATHVQNTCNERAANVQRTCDVKTRVDKSREDLYLYTLAHATNVACAVEQPEEAEKEETTVEQVLFAETVQDFDGNVEADMVTVTSNETSKRTSPRPPFNSKRQEEWFDTFWKEYPKKRNKGQAERAWIKLRVDETLFQAIMDGLSRAKESYEWQKEGGQYIPYPATWLNAKGWEDEYRPAVASSARPRADPSVSRMRAYFEALEEFVREGGEEP